MVHVKYCRINCCDDMNAKKEHVLQHMRRLWNNWRGSLHKNMKSKPFCDALKDVPRGVDKSDWEWLVKEHFLSDKFKVQLHSIYLLTCYLKQLTIIFMVCCEYRKQVLETLSTGLN